MRFALENDLQSLCRLACSLAGLALAPSYCPCYQRLIRYAAYQMQLDMLAGRLIVTEPAVCLCRAASRLQSCKLQKTTQPESRRKSNRMLLYSSTLRQLLITPLKSLRFCQEVMLCFPKRAKYQLQFAAQLRDHMQLRQPLLCSRLQLCVSTTSLLLSSQRLSTCLEKSRCSHCRHNSSRDVLLRA